MADQIEWLNTDQAAKRLGITARTLYRFIDEGQVPAYRFGRVIRLKQDDVDVFIEECRIDPGSLGSGQGDSTPNGDGAHEQAS
ncbi:MAG: helix-turn-helix domain-containing protein [Microthrixaceae bacterium]